MDKIPILDLIFVIDTTQSMDCMIEYFNNKLAYIIKYSIEYSVNFFPNTKKVRAKIVQFKSLQDKEGFINESELFDATDYDSIDVYAKTMRASGGGDIIEDGFAALSYALKINDSYDESKYSYRSRCIIFFSDNDTKLPDSTMNCPSSVQEFAAILIGDKEVYGINPKNLKILFFAPKGSHYEELAKMAPNVIYHKGYGKMGDGMIGFLWNDPKYVLSLIRY